MFWTIVGALVFFFIVLPIVWWLFRGAMELSDDMAQDLADKRRERIADRKPVHIDKPPELSQSGTTRKKMRSFRLDM